MEIARDEGLNSEARMVERGGILGQGMFPSPSARVWGSAAVSSPSRVRGTTWRFRRFTKPLLV